VEKGQAFLRFQNCFSTQNPVPDQKPALTPVLLPVQLTVVISFHSDDIFAASISDGIIGQYSGYWWLWRTSTLFGSATRDSSRLFLSLGNS